MGDHYIPKYYLKQFADSTRKDSIWVFRNGNLPFITAIRKIAQEDEFYSNQVEKLLANEVEDPVKKIFNKIQERKSISQDEKISFAKYMMVMWKRVPRTKEWMKMKSSEIMDPVFERFKKRLDELQLQNPEKTDFIEKQQKELQNLQVNKGDGLIQDIWLSSIPPEKTPLPIEILSKMTWRFMIAETENFFITSDNPLFFFPWMGIGKEESEVTFPITKDIALWASWRKDLREGFFQARNQMVKEVNRRTVFISTQFLFSPYSEEWITILANKPKNQIKMNRII